jgi:hypothetical protein
MATMNLPDIILWYNDARSRWYGVLYHKKSRNHNYSVLLLQNQNELICNGNVITNHLALELLNAIETRLKKKDCQDLL